jgi:hypothetical protein
MPVVTGNSNRDDSHHNHEGVQTTLFNSPSNMPSLKLSNLAVLIALLALASIALALPGPGTCTCAKNGAKGDVGSCDTAECYNFCKGKGATGTEKCVTKPKHTLSTAAKMSPITETEAFMVQKAMFAIPCDLCEVTVADVQKIPEASCVTALDNACKVVQKKFPEVKCSNLLETLACGVVRTLLTSQTPAQICTQVAKCQAPALEMQSNSVVEPAAHISSRPVGPTSPPRHCLCENGVTSRAVKCGDPCAAMCADYNSAVKMCNTACFTVDLTGIKEIPC